MEADPETSRYTYQHHRVFSIGYYRISNKLTEVIHEIKKLDMDIVALSETKKKESGNTAIDDYMFIWSGISKSERAKAGVALLVKKKWVKYIKNIQYVNERCLVVKIELYGKVTSILAVYEPTEDSPDQVKTEFYERLTSLIQNIPNKQQIVVAGDMNVRDSIRRMYERRLNGYLQTNHGSAQDEEMDIENEYKHILEAFYQAAREVLGAVEQQRKPSQGWWSKEMADAVKKKERAYNSWLSHKTAESRRNYNRSKAALKNRIKKARNNFWKNKCKEIDCMIDETQSAEVWRFLRNLKTNTKNKLNLIITLNKQANYYEKLLTETKPQFTNEVVEIEATNRISKSIGVLPQQVRRAIHSMKNGKAPGPGEQWKTSFITLLYKKGDRKDMSNYRSLSVNSTLSRFFGKVIKALLEDQVGSIVSEEQSGFTAGQSCVDNLFVVHSNCWKKE
ncbi:uncharacterized protein LOC143895675 [Temnothorax americanus]|uniref:uncharacterized protein LOC143895675 n=1 Tax=Temnothorax americanus TaxID=1964332 RepID=UPI004068BD40